MAENRGAGPLYKKALEKYSEEIGRMTSVDRYDYEDAGVQKRMETRLFDFSRRALEFMWTEFEPCQYKCEFSKQSAGKRSSTLARYAKTVHDRFADRYPKLCVEDEFFSVNNAVCDDTFNYANDRFHLTYAIALWILDELDRHSKLRDAVIYLPPYESSFEDLMDIPDYEDPCHSRQLIARMMYVIENRDFGRGKKSGGAVFVNKGSLSFKGKRTYAPVPFHEGITVRERFDSIISMIPQPVITRAAERFEEKEWEFLGLCLDILNSWKLERIRLTREITEELRRKIGEDGAPCAGPGIFSSPNAGGACAPLLPFSDPAARKEAKKTPFDGPEGVLGSSALFLDGITEKDERCAQLDKFRKSLLLLFWSDTDPDGLLKEDRLDEKSAQRLSGFSTRNPYETLFAFLYLLDSGSGLPWLYNQTLFILSTAANQLPWAFEHIKKRDWKNEPPDGCDFDFDGECEYDEDDEDDEDGEDDEDDEDDGYGWDDDGEPEDWIDEEEKIYRREYTDACLWCDPDSADPERFIKMNLAQILFENTDVIMPRDVSDNGIAPLLEKSGFEPSEAKAFERYCALASSYMHKEAFEAALQDGGGGPETGTGGEGGSDETPRETPRETPDEIPEETPEEIPEEPPEKLSEEDASCGKEEIERLENELDILHRSRNEFRKRTESLSAENERLKAEISRLRGIISSAERGAVKKEAKEQIEYPYELSHRFVVCGGHPSWLRAIRLLLKNVRFVDCVSPDSNLIRNADAVWIQANAITHAFYYNIINTARANAVPLKYFSFAGAEKCAEEIINFDRRMN